MKRTAAVLPWAIWVLSALFVVFNYIHQVVPDIIAADLALAFKATDATLGNIAAIYFYAYAILQIPVGLIVDHFGTRRPLVVAILAAGLGALAFSRAGSSGDAELARLVMGASSAFSFIGCLKLVQEWFPPSRFSTLAGMTNTAGMIGAASGAPVASVVNVLGWRATVGWMGWAELALGVLVLLVVRDRVQAGSHPEPAPRPAQMIGVLTDPQVWINAVYATSISLVFVAFGGLWGASYIEKAYGMSAIEAADVGSLLFLGGIAGSLFFGWWSDHLGRRKRPMVIAGVGALATMAALLYLPGLPILGFEAAIFLVGFFSSANIVSYAVARDLYPRLAGLSIGFLSTCYYAGSAASQPLVGMLLERSQAGGGLAALTAADYRVAFSPLVGFMAVGLVAALLIRETLHPAGAARLAPGLPG
ncbi:Sugar phosphate permease [Enhydrobacter aerosaccus]|uniref:Sugar phosphate permease n=1 Tax=Enhydrobacter aerosaccus TaxID=225324 RepID=A0A1T4SRW6_9HYPH|nr:MFS transporter [Enhydrobacter aerosaccus]SKA30631.1 Sugar phosphate permease [Enhydrobacter aerosaccus]